MDQVLLDARAPVPRRRTLSIQRIAVVVAVLALYLHTWIGGSQSHLQAITTDSHARFAEAEEQEKGLADWAKAAGVPPYPTRLRTGGPIARLNWSIPLLPGLLLADSQYVIGPLYGSGSAKLVVYYGFGSFTLCELWGWRS